MLKFCLLLALVVLLGCQPGDMFYREFDTCGGKEYEVGYGLVCENDILVYKCGDVVYDPETSNQFCSYDRLHYKCNGQTYSVSTEKCRNDTLLTKCGNDYYHQETSNQFCSGSKFYDKCGGKTYDPRISIYCSDGELVFDYKVLIDSRDDKKYKTIIIGTQNWMAENLRYETSNTKCFNNNLDNCEIHGIAYDWNTAKTVCPVGWHLPSDEEWDTLKNFTWNYHYAGYELKANSELWGNGSGTDRYGFSALPGGYFGKENILGIPFFSSTDVSETYPGSAKIYVILSDELGLLFAHKPIDSIWAYVRCVED